MLDIEKIGTLARFYLKGLDDLKERGILSDAEEEQAKEKVKAEIKKELGL